MGTSETQLLRRLELDEPRLQIRLKAVWATFTALRQALRRALEEGDEAAARALAAQIRALIAGHQSSPRRLVVKGPKPGQAMRPGAGLVILTDKSRTKPSLALRNGKLNQAPRPAPRQIIHIPSIAGGDSPRGGTGRFQPTTGGSAATPRITILTHDASRGEAQPRLGKGFAVDHGFAYIEQAGSRAFDELIAQAARPGRRELAFKVELPKLEIAAPDLPPDDTPPSPPPPVDFQFRLEGSGARGSAVALGGEADLVFFLGTLRADSLATACGPTSPTPSSSHPPRTSRKASTGCS